MKRTQTFLLSLALLIAILAVAGRALAYSGGYTLIRGVTQNNGVIATQSQHYQLKATIGQPIVGASTAGNTELRAGYWYRFEEIISSDWKQYLPIIKR